MSKLDSEFKAAEQSLGFLLWKASNRLQREHRKALLEFNLKPPEFSLLACIVFLDAENKGLSQQKIASHSGLDKMYVSDIVNRLLKKRLISKKKNPLDGRSFLIRSTAQGEETANKAVKCVENLDRDFFSTLSKPSLFLREIDLLCRD